MIQIASRVQIEVPLRHRTFNKIILVVVVYVTAHIYFQFRNEFYFCFVGLRQIMKEIERALVVNIVQHKI
jgi:hypothetical protein